MFGTFFHTTFYGNLCEKFCRCVAKIRFRTDFYVDNLCFSFEFAGLRGFPSSAILRAYPTICCVK